MSMLINAKTRENQGKGASRRLRRQEQIPGIVYGGDKKPIAISANIHEITHLLENEEAFTSILKLKIDKDTQSVIVKDLQRHPVKKYITHIDLQRINLKQTIVTRIPLNFTGEEENAAVRMGAVINKFVTTIEISCLPNDLPHGIDISISALEIGDHLSLTDLIAPKGVDITALQHEDIAAHNQTIVSIMAARKIEEEEEEDTQETETETEDDKNDENKDKKEES